MAVKIPNLIQRNGIYYFRCRIPSNLTCGQYREVKISLKKRQFDSLLLGVITKASDYFQQIVIDFFRKNTLDNAMCVFEIRKQISQYIKNILVKHEFHAKTHCEYLTSRPVFEAAQLKNVEKIDTLGDLVKAYLAMPHGNDAKYNADIVNTLNLLCEDEQEQRAINERLAYIADHIHEQPEICIKYFISDEHKSGGAIIEFSGRVKKLSTTDATIVLTDGCKIKTSDITNLSILSVE